VYGASGTVPAGTPTLSAMCEQAVQRSLRAPVLPVSGANREARNLAARLALGATVARYLTSVLGPVRRELAHWRERACAIPDPALAAHARASLSKRGNMEGAALFAVFAPASRRRETVRALVAFQTAYNYLDSLCEQPSADPVANGRQLHRALLVALDPAAGHPDYYALHPQREDGGFLLALVDTCRTALAALPSHAAVAADALAAAERIVSFQSLNLTERQGGQEALERWARREIPDGSGLAWWQTAGAAGSSLVVHALIATAARPDVTRQDVAAIEAAYFPWACALHSLLDSLVDVAEDERAGQHSLLGYYASPQQAAFAMKILARRATEAVDALPDERHHRVVLTAMAGHYLSSPEAHTPYADAITADVAAAVGPLLGPVLVLFKARRALARLTGGERW
jgi:tetraprenyl-beta-curcumene synthase